LIVTSYNQAMEIGNVLRRIEQVFPKQDVVVIDDGSTDGSPDIARGLGFLVIVHPSNRGVGAAMRTGYHHALKQGYEYVCITSSNGKILPEEIPKIAGPVARDEVDYTTGSRFMKGGSSPGLPPFRRYAIPVFTLAANLTIGRWFSDITCGFRAYKLSVITHPSVNIDQEWLDRYELEYYVHYKAAKQAIRILEVPVEIRYTHLQKGRQSKIRPVVGWWSMIRPFVLLKTGLRS
jgi:dolichol-phosphate mannosyltransferase